MRARARCVGWWVAAGLAAAALAEGADLGAVRERGVLRALMVAPAEATDPSRQQADSADFDPQGRFDREVLDGFARLHGLQVRVIAVQGYDRLIPALLEEKGDLIAGTFTVTEGRKKLIDFTAEVFPSRDVILSRRPTPAIETLDSLRALAKIGAVRGSSEWQALLDAGVPVAAIGALTNLSEDLRSGRFQAVVAPVEQAIDTARADPQLQIGTSVGPPSSYAFGVRKQDATLRSALSEYVANLRRGSGWSRLVVKYYGEGAADILRKIRN